MKFLLLLLLCAPAFGQFANGYTYRRALTVQAGKITGTLTDFPVLVSGTYSYLATVANGGLVTDAQGDDVIFTAANGTTVLKHEIEQYTATTGAVTYWVKVPSAAVGTVIYIYYGNASVTTNQSDPTNVWDSNFKGVWHLPNGTTLTALDSTSGATNGTLVNTPTAAAATVYGGAQFASASSQYINAGNVAPIQITGNLTISAWVYLTTVGSFYQAICKDDLGSGAYNMQFLNTGQPAFYINGGGTPGTNEVRGTALSATTWTHVVGVYTTAGTLALYRNGVADGTATGGPTSINTNSSPLMFARRDNGAFPDYMNGRLDEVRISNTARSAAWALAEYDTSVSPSTFYSVGSQEVGTGAGRRRSVFIP